MLISVLNVLHPQYGIVLDAGSSHTNLYIYKWPAEKENDTGVVYQLEECQVKGMREAGEVGRMGHESRGGTDATQEQKEPAQSHGRSTVELSLVFYCHYINCDIEPGLGAQAGEQEAHSFWSAWTTGWGYMASLDSVEDSASNKLWL